MIMRTIDDQWDITSSVGATALAVAAGRAVETRRDDGLVDDPLAAAFLAAAGPTTLPERPWESEEWQLQSTYMGVRSRYFDQALTAVATAGVRQVVLLAAGLDTRAVRLDWPSGTTVFEIDQPRVLEFKNRVLDEQGAGPGPGTTRVTVPVDLRHDWPAALRDAGFDPSLPTAWLAEGLLPYLPADAESLLFDRVRGLSAPGSRIAVEHFGDCLEAMADDEGFLALTRRLFGSDIRTLFFDEPRAETPDALLRDRGWSVTGTNAAETAGAYGRPLPDDVVGHMGRAGLLTADLPTP